MNQAEQNWYSLLNWQLWSKTILQLSSLCHHACFINPLKAKFLSYRNHSIDMQYKSLRWFLYDNNFISL